MRNIPFFTTNSGVAGLTLSEIPYKGIAYVTVQSAYDLELLLKECCDFCCAAGATSIYATGHKDLEKYPFHTDIIRMRRPLEGIAKTDAVASLITEIDLDQWRRLYNDRMYDISNAATMTYAKSLEILTARKGYFVYHNNTLIGLGVAAGTDIEAVISISRGKGRDVLLALCGVLCGAFVEVEVATENDRAIRLYERLGFAQHAQISRWYKIA